MILRYSLVFFAILFSSSYCDVGSWIDPSDPHALDRISRTPNQGAAKRPNSNFDYQDVDPYDPHGINIPASKRNKNDKNTDESMSKLQKELVDCKQNSAAEPQDHLMNSLLQRQASMILKAANLLTVPAESSSYYEKYMIVALNQEDLTKLQDFATTGKIDPHTLDEIWSRMLVQADNPDVLRWHDLSYWKPELSISRETFCMFVAVGGVIALIVMMAMGVPLTRIILIVLVMAFAFSVTMRAFRVHQANTARLHSLRNPDKMKDMPSACRPFDRNVWEDIRHKIFSSMKFDEVTCSKYYEEGYTDPMTQIDIYELIIMQFSETTVTVSTSFGKAFGAFFENAFGDLSGWLATAVRTVAKLAALLIILVVSVFSFIWLAPSLIKESVRSTFHAITNRNQHEAAALTSRQQPAPIIVNVNLPSGGIISNEITPPRRLSEPAPPIKAVPYVESIKLKRLLSEPAFKESERLAPIVDSAEPPLVDVIEQTQSPSDVLPVASADQEGDQNQKTESSDEILIPSNLNLPVVELDMENSLSNSSTEPDSPFRDANLAPKEVKSPFLTELERLVDDEQADCAEE
ncbi:Hypothetical predicted protein [Cloeon dipterum]|uniref:Chloride channel CLIC-like protein 1 n=1 Tax=Cloeon dipterum TaxID=197152 RepID=A0A8S1DHL9_9INSE|nr:Hypothetical predicted protein [Cloeon dipterum]